MLFGEGLVFGLSIIMESVAKLTHRDVCLFLSSCIRCTKDRDGNVGYSCPSCSCCGCLLLLTIFLVLGVKVLGERGFSLLFPCLSSFSQNLKKLLF